MKKILKLKSTSRVHLVNPNHQEINEISDKYDLHEIIEQDLKESNTQDKVDVYDNHIFLVIHFPKYQENNKKHFSNEFNFIIGKNSIISFSSHPTQTIDTIKDQYLQDLKDADDEDKELRSSPYYILYRILDALYDKTLTGLNKFNRDLSLLEEEIFEGKTLGQTLLENLMVKSRNTSFLKNIIEPQAEILEELNNTTKKKYSGDLDVYFEDLEYKVDKINNTIERLYQHTESLSSKYNTLVTLKTNSIITILTIATVIVGFLTLITGFYGMNVQLPGQKFGPIRLIITLGMIFIAIVMLIIFRKKRRL